MESSAPSDKLVENLDILLYVFDLCWFLCIEDRERRDWGAVIDVAAAWLEETADKDDLEEGVCILEELELPTGRD